MPTQVPAQRGSWPLQQDYLTVRVEYVESVVVLRFHGDVDALTSDAMRTAVLAELDRVPAALVLDLSTVGFLGCAGLSVLAEADSLSRRAGIPMCVVSTCRCVLRPLFVSGLRDRLRLRPSLTRALHDFGCTV